MRMKKENKINYIPVWISILIDCESASNVAEVLATGANDILGFGVYMNKNKFLVN